MHWECIFKQSALHMNVRVWRVSGYAEYCLLDELICVVDLTNQVSFAFVISMNTDLKTEGIMVSRTIQLKYVYIPTLQDDRCECKSNSFTETFTPTWLRSCIGT